MATWKNVRTGQTVDIPDEPPEGSQLSRTEWERLQQSMRRTGRWQLLDSAASEESGDDPGSEPGGDEMESWSLAQLREEAERRGLPTSGTKAELRERLTSEQ